MRSIFLYEHLTAGGWSPELDPTGSLLAEGTAMRDALAGDLADIGEIETVHLLHDARLRTPHIPKQQLRVVSRFQSENPEIADFVRQGIPVILIAPESGKTLCSLAQIVENLNGKLISPRFFVVHICTNKFQMNQHLRRHRVNVPVGISLPGWPQPLDPKLLPAILKPFDGCGSQGVQMIESWEELAAIDLGTEPNWLLEHFHRGTPLSVSVLMGPLGVLPLQPCTQRLSDDGRFTYLGGETPIAEHLAERAKKLAKAAAESLPPCRGYIGIDMVLGSAENGSQDVVIEINPRLTASYLILRQACEQNLAEAMLKWAEGEPVELAWRPQRFEFAVPETK